MDMDYDDYPTDYIAAGLGSLTRTRLDWRMLNIFSRKFLLLGVPTSFKYYIIKKAKSYALLLRGVGILFSKCRE